MIVFQKGQVYNNRSKKYLGSILYDCPSWIKSYILKTTHKGTLANCNGFFLGDLEYRSATKDTHKYLLFIVTDINGEYNETKCIYKNISSGRNDFRSFLKEFRKNKKYGHWDYVFGDLYHSHRHVFVFDMSQWSKSFDAFEEGKYSKMFTQDELKRIGITKVRGGKINEIWQTFTGDISAKEIFKKRIQKEFGTILKDDDVATMDTKELDIKYFPQQEILHYTK